MSSHLIRPAAEEKRPWRYMELAASVYTLALLCIFPFVVHNKYFDILPTKYQAYAVLMRGPDFHCDLSDRQRSGSAWDSVASGRDLERAFKLCGLERSGL